MSDEFNGTLLPPGFQKPEYLKSGLFSDVYYLQGTMSFGEPDRAFMNTQKYTHEYKDNILHINRIEEPKDDE